MKFSVARSYMICIDPEEGDDLEDSEYCRLTVDMTCTDTVMFTADIPCCDVINGLLGRCPGGIWFLDPYTNYGFLLEAPFCFDDIYDEIQENDRYDESQWLLLSKCIEVIAGDLFPVFLAIDHTIPKTSCFTRNDTDEFPF